MLIIAFIVIYSSLLQPAPTPSPTISPTGTPPLVKIGFEEAVEQASEGAYRTAGKWKFTEYRWLGSFQGETFVTVDGLIEGQFEWRAINGTLYEAEYPSGKIIDEIERYSGVEDDEEYYVWQITLLDGAVCHIDSRNGEFLSFSPSRFPGLLTFEAAARVVNAPEPKIEEWEVHDYKRLADFESKPYETPDGLIKGHLLRRTSNGTLYEVIPPIILDLRGKLLHIEVSGDSEEYNVWEIRDEKNFYYIDARNGAIRLIY